MPIKLEVLFTPAEFEALSRRDLSETVCVVFDVLRATSTIVTALANGASRIIPVAEIGDALALRRQHPELLLAGERDGLRIHRGLTGGIDFDLGNSPREFTAERVQEKSIVITTTNGSRALRACSPAKATFAASFLNLAVTAAHVRTISASQWILVCSGTGNYAAYEDVLGAGALATLLWPVFAESEISDSAKIAREIYESNQGDLMKAMTKSANGRRLLSLPDLRDDVACCLERDRFALIAKLEGDSLIRSK